ncbi:hypothetical protein TNCT_696081 [Trichonephila clavata]|uniref:Uncharacterized protein n=1 Tax=Trichonephila clavata TaxID=2740835 RepID=A0A8X6HTW2_TRICU|nr:hypothetical protein TNCT_696081 [Trichonephila clavata]
MEHYIRSLAGYGNVSIYSSISNFKSIYAPNKCTYLDQAGGRREIVLPYLQMKRLRNPRTEGKRIFTSLMDLPPVNDMVLGRQSE